MRVRVRVCDFAKIRRAVCDILVPDFVTSDLVATVFLRRHSVSNRFVFGQAEVHQ